MSQPPPIPTAQHEHPVPPPIPIYAEPPVPGSVPRSSQPDRSPIAYFMRNHPAMVGIFLILMGLCATGMIISIALPQYQPLLTAIMTYVMGGVVSLFALLLYFSGIVLIYVGIRGRANLDKDMKKTILIFGNIFNMIAVGLFAYGLERLTSETGLGIGLIAASFIILVVGVLITTRQ